jgi:hypothetical protein
MLIYPTRTDLQPLGSLRRSYGDEWTGERYSKFGAAKLAGLLAVIDHC